MDDADKLKQLGELFSRDPFASRLGVEIVDLSPGYAKVRMQVDESHLNFNRFVHGGMIFTLLDQAFAAASNSHNVSSVAIGMDVQFINAPSPSDTLFAEAKEVEKSRKLGLYDMRVWDQNKKLICKCSGRVYRIGNPIVS